MYQALLQNKKLLFFPTRLISILRRILHSERRQGKHTDGLPL